MIRNSRLLILLILVATSVISCSQYRTITIENLQAPKISIPEEIQSLTLMNRSMTDEFHDFAEDSIQQYFYQKAFKVKANILDSLASDTCLQAIGELLYESGRFDIVIPVERNIKRESTYYKIDQPLSWDTVSQICNTYNTDALLVMEKYVNSINSDFKAEVNGFSPNGDPIFSYFYASFDILYSSFFRIYDPAKEEIVGQFFISDTIFWENGDIDQRTLFSKLGSIKEGLVATGIKVALDIDNKLSPTWKRDSRGIFTIERKNKMERQLVDENNWTQFAEYLQPLTEKSNKKIRSKAEFNMALVSELDGRIDDAIEWAAKSHKSSFHNQTLVYLKKLKKRKAELIQIEESQNIDK